MKVTVSMKFRPAQAIRYTYTGGCMDFDPEQTQEEDEPHQAALQAGRFKRWSSRQTRGTSTHWSGLLKQNTGAAAVLRQQKREVFSHTQEAS